MDTNEQKPARMSEETKQDLMKRGHKVMAELDGIYCDLHNQLADMTCTGRISGLGDIGFSNISGMLSYIESRKQQILELREKVEDLIGQSNHETLVVAEFISRIKNVYAELDLPVSEVIEGPNGLVGPKYESEGVPGPKGPGLDSEGEELLRHDHPPLDYALTKEDVQWVVNDSAELGVKIGDQFFFLYKGRSLVYPDGKHDDGTPMLYRPVGKREFGECCHPKKFYEPGALMPKPYTDTVVFSEGLSFGDPKDYDWKPIGDNE